MTIDRMNWIESGATNRQFMREGVMARFSEAAGFAVPKERPKL
jgi:hypothetical protein